MCSKCSGIPFGTDENKVWVKMPDDWKSSSKDRLIWADACMVYELHTLWKNGVRTNGCCCGHGKYLASIVVDKTSIEKMVNLGYENHPDYIDRQDVFIGKLL